MPNAAPNPDPSLADPGRLAALAETGLLDSPPEAAFDRLTRLAGRILGTPVALVSLITDDRQFLKSSAGLPEEAAREMPLSHSFCQMVVRSARPLIVADALADPNLRDHGAVRDLNVRAYAGVPLTTSDGQILGSFCAVDTEPREWTEDDLATLRTLADSVQTEIELRGAARRAEQEARRAEQGRRETVALLEATAEGLYGIDADGLCTFVNPAASRMLGVAPGELLGKNLHPLIHHHRPDGLPYPEGDCPIYRTLATGESAKVENDVFFRPDGSEFPVDYGAAPLREAGATVGAVVSFSDITVRREAEALMRAALAHERHVAETLQHTILEDIPEHRFPGLAVASRYLAAWEEAQIGGDFYDAFALDGGKAVFVVGDASGKGLAAAIRTAEVKFALRAFLRQEPSPSLALAMVNDFACAAQRLESRASDAFVALAVAVVEAETGQVWVATAGAEPPLVLRVDGTVESLQTQGVPIGFLPDHAYAPGERILGAGDILLLATDGITEARRGKSFLGPEGMGNLAWHAASQTKELGDIAQAVLNGARAFAGGTLHDDACLLLVRRAS